MLHEEVELYSRLTGNDGYKTPISIIGAYLDGYEKGRTEAPEVIRCGECAKMQLDTIFHDCWCSETNKKVWIDHFCGYAERRN